MKNENKVKLSRVKSVRVWSQGQTRDRMVEEEEEDSKARVSWHPLPRHVSSRSRLFPLKLFLPKKINLFNFFENYSFKKFSKRSKFFYVRY